MHSAITIGTASQVVRRPRVAIAITTRASGSANDS